MSFSMSGSGGAGDADGSRADSPFSDEEQLYEYNNRDGGRKVDLSTTIRNWEKPQLVKLSLRRTAEDEERGITTTYERAGCSSTLTIWTKDFTTACDREVTKDVVTKLIPAPTFPEYSVKVTRTGKYTNGKVKFGLVNPDGLLDKDVDGARLLSTSSQEKVVEERGEHGTKIVTTTVQARILSVTGFTEDKESRYATEEELAKALRADLKSVSDIVDSLPEPDMDSDCSQYDGSDESDGEEGSA